MSIYRHTHGMRNNKTQGRSCATLGLGKLSKLNKLLGAAALIKEKKRQTAKEGKDHLSKSEAHLLQQKNSYHHLAAAEQVSNLLKHSSSSTSITKCLCINTSTQ